MKNLTKLQPVAQSTQQTATAPQQSSKPLGKDFARELPVPHGVRGPQNQNKA